MWTFLGSECLLFGGLISTFLLYKEEAAGGKTPHDLYDIAFTSISSFVLLMSSLTLVLAVSAIQRGDHRIMRAWLLTTAMLGTIFISGQVFEFKVPMGFGPTWRYEFHAVEGGTRVVESMRQDKPSPWFIRRAQVKAGVTDRAANITNGMEITLNNLERLATA